MRLKPVLFSCAFLVLSSTTLAADFMLNGDLKAQAEQFVKVENAEHLVGIKKVAITSFMVDFVTELQHSKAISGLGLAMGGDSDVSIKLIGANNEQFQAIAEKLYAETVEQLTAKGIEVVGKDALAALPEFTELSSRGLTPLPSLEDAKAGKGLFFTAQGLPLYHMDEKAFITSFNPFDKPQEDNFLTFGSRFSSGFSAGQNADLEEKIAQKLNASVLKVRLTLLGGQLKPDTSFWSTGGKVSTRAAASFASMVNRYAFITPQGKKARVSLKEAIGTDDVGELVNVTTGATKAADTAKTIVSIASFAARLGGVGVPSINAYSSTNDFECRVQPESFEKSVLAQYKGVAGMFTEKMVASSK